MISSEKNAARSAGMLGENLACSFLVEKGFRILTRNFRTRGGEIDVIATDGRELVFVEVKARRTTRYGYPEESVSRQKIKRLSRAMQAYLSTHTVHMPHRFDVVALTIGESGGHIQIRHIIGVETMIRM